MHNSIFPFGYLLVHGKKKMLPRLLGRTSSVEDIHSPSRQLNGAEQFSHSADIEKNPHFSISLTRETYFDNDIVEGTLTIRASSEVVIPKLTVAIVCRLIVRDVITPDFKAAHTLYKSSKVWGLSWFGERA